MFKIGSPYSRSEIHGQIGGGLQSCFLVSSRTVVGVCLRPDLNPHAPKIVLVGFGPQKEKAAETLYGQGTAVPVFMKVSVNRWTFRGMFTAVKCSSLNSDVSFHSEGSGRTDVSKVLWLKAD
jgi:hypothetical protein